MDLIGSGAPLSRPFPVKGKGCRTTMQRSATVFILGGRKIIAHFVVRSDFRSERDNLGPPALKICASYTNFQLS